MLGRNRAFSFLIPIFVVLGACLLTSSAFAVTPETGYWWNPNTPGTGLIIEVQGSSAYTASFLYDSTGQATWILGYGTFSNSTLSATLGTYCCGQTLTGPYQKDQSTGSPGTITITFSDPQHGTMTWPGGSNIAIQRFSFTNSSTPAPPQAGAPQSGFWWNPNESGRGWAIEFQGNSIFVIGFMYAANGSPIWYLTYGAMQSPTSYQGQWNQYCCGQTLTGPYQPDQFQASVGATSIQFTSAATGVITLPNGVQTQIQRFQFGTTVSISPTSATVATGGTQQFTASVQSPSNTSVTWSADGVAGGNATTGTVSASGLYTAPTTAGTHQVTATSVADPSQSASATVAVQAGPASGGVSISISPTAATIAGGTTQQFTAAVAGTTDTSVIWTVDGTAGGSSTAGTISTTGLYTAPATPGTHTVTATSNADPSKSASATVTVTSFGVFTRQYDNARTGQNLNETTLTPSNVNSSRFGKLCSYAVDGALFAEPLYVSGLNMGAYGVRHVVFAATMHDSVYAFDATCGTSIPFWQTSFLNPAAGVTTVPGSAVGDTQEYGVMATPVIDPSTNTIFVLARTQENGTYHQRLHALDLMSGVEKFGGPVEITATVPGTGDGSSGGMLSFNPLTENSRPGMLLVNGVVYMTWASIEDITPYHGWLIGYDAHTLAQVAVFNSTPNGMDGGVWQSGGGLAADGFGNIFAVTGNGTFDAFSGGKDFGSSFLKLSTAAGGLAVSDYFTPFNQASLNNSDYDVGSGGPVLLPPQPGAHPNLVVAGSKDGTIYVVDRDHMGQYQAVSNAQIVQTLSGAVTPVYSSPAYWNGNFYIAGTGDNLKAFSVTNGLLSSAPTSMSQTTYGYPGATPSVSANGNGNGIVWTLERGLYTVLHAYDATNLNNELYNSEQVPARDRGGLTVQFVTPLVANGRVYMGCNQSLVVYGLLPLL